MISLTKKKESAQVYNWRPNFRDYESLPELRAVRTKFFLPTVFITVAVVFASYITVREFKAMDLSAGIQAIEEEIAADDKRHSDIVKLNSEYMGIVRNLEEINEYEADQLLGSDFLLSLSSRLLDGMYLTSVSFGGSGVEIEGNLEVPAEEASRIVDHYLKSLKEADVVQGRFSDYKLTSLDRSKNEGVINFRIEIVPEETGKKKGR